MKNAQMIPFPIKLFLEMDWRNIPLYALIINCKYSLRIYYVYEIFLFCFCSYNRLVHKNLKDSKIGRGINLVAFDTTTFDVKLTETFDTYIEGKLKKRLHWKPSLYIVLLETFFLRALKLSLNDGDIIVLASFDEITYGLVNIIEN